MLKFEYAKREDVPEVLDFIRMLAEYEHMSDEVVADVATLEHWLFDEKKAEVLFAVADGEDGIADGENHIVNGENGIADGERIGFALFFHNFSTFLGRAGLYLEDLYIKEEYRGKGYGKALFTELARIAVERGCGRFEWWCLDWNQPSIDFYKSMGAVPMDDWTVYRITGETLQNLGK